MKVTIKTKTNDFIYEGVQNIKLYKESKTIFIVNDKIYGFNFEDIDYMGVNENDNVTKS